MTGGKYVVKIYFANGYFSSSLGDIENGVMSYRFSEFQNMYHLYCSW